MGSQPGKKQGHRPAGSPAGSGGQFDEVRRDAVDVDLTGPRPFSKEHVLANLDYWLTDDGFDELVGTVNEVAAQGSWGPGGTGSDPSLAVKRFCNSPLYGLPGSASQVLGVVTQARAENSRAELARGASYPPDVASVLDREVQTPPVRLRVQDDNGNWLDATTIGSITVTDSFCLRQSYRRRAWFRDHRIKPGTYPLHMVQGRVAVLYETTVVDADTAPRFYGVPIGPTDPNEIGQDSSFGANARIESIPGAYAPGIELFGGHMALRQGVTLYREPHFSEFGLSLPTRIGLPDD